MLHFAHEVSMHMPTPDPREDEEEPDVKQPPVPPDQEPEVVPQGDPPKPGEHTPMIAAVFASLLAACAPLSPLERTGPRAMVDDAAVRSVYFAGARTGCGAGPCAGPVPVEYVAFFRRELAAVGFEMVDMQGRQAPVIRIRADHVATTPTECTMEGTLYVADNTVEVKRTYAWPRGVSPTISSHELQRHVLRSCLAAFARSLRDALATSAAPGTAYIAP